MTFDNGYLSYEVWGYRNDTKAVGEDRLERLVGSGQILVTNTMSSPVTVPDAGLGWDVAVRLRNTGSWSPMFVQFSNSGGPSGTGARAAVDAQPRIFLDGERKTALVNVAEGSSFAAVLLQLAV